MTARKTLTVTCDVPECERYGQTDVRLQHPSLVEMEGFWVCNPQHAVGRWLIGDKITGFVEVVAEAEGDGKGWVQVLTSSPYNSFDCYSLSTTVRHNRDADDVSCLVLALQAAKQRIEAVTQPRVMLT